MSRVVVRDLAVVVTVDAQDTVLHDVTVVVEDGVITSIGPSRKRWLGGTPASSAGR